MDGWMNGWVGECEVGWIGKPQKHKIRSETKVDNVEKTRSAAPI